MNFHGFSPEVATGVFGLHYVLAALLCGLLVRSAMRSRSTSEIAGEEAIARSGTDEQRYDIAWLLLGSAFAPLAIGWLQSVWLIAIPGLPRVGYVVLHWSVMAIGVALLRRQLVCSLRSCLSFCFCRFRRAVGTCVLLMTMSVVAFWAITSALLPWAHYDSTSYALDARRLAEGREYSALLSETPDERNHLTLGHHGKSYQSFLSVSLLYPSSTKEHLPLRVAPRILYSHVVLCIAALGMQVSAATGLLAGLLLVAFYPPLYWLVNAASRDGFRLLAIISVIGIAGSMECLKTKAGRGCLFVAFAYVWHAHSSSILVAPTLAVCLLISLATNRKAVVTFILLFVVAAVVGGFGALESTLKHGKPGLFGNPNWQGTPLLAKYWESRTESLGSYDLLYKWHHHWETDGKLLVTMIFVSLAVMIASRPWRGKTNNRTLLIVMLFVVVSELQIAGLFDLVQKQISTAFYLNFRYRSHVVLIGCVLAAATICRLLKESRFLKTVLLLDKPVGQVVVATAATGLLVWTTWSIFDRYADWFKPEQPYCARWDDFQRELRTKRWWGGYLSVIDRLSPDERVLTEGEYYVWYYCDHPNVMSVLDPRTRPIWHARDRNEALRSLEDLNIHYVHLTRSTLNLLKATDAGFFKTLQADFEPLQFDDDVPYVMFKRRIATLSQPRLTPGLRASDN